ncbi:RecQ family ATP-dependent DNA helicase [Microbacterium timonense]|uniref:RecQ family ATP-dependent DNA helicase n=1 Tax=Microbacterium timonense TaxID=2086576 RepID=UPI000D106532|nr:RecQ family ATP-dependent DNA helicase [Microbacterium timonense]
MTPAAPASTLRVRQPSGEISRERIQEVARASFGLDQLHGAQLDAIEAAANGRDVLVVRATGWGKSAVYQVAAALRDGVTVIVSPLIALQEDQLVGLRDAPDAPGAVALNSARGVRARAQAWRRLRDGEAQLVLLAPEQLAKDDVVDELARLDVTMLVVDEAHCIASWGHDFRPDYLALGTVAERLGRPPIVALTATASTPVREEIVARLHLRDAAVILGDVDRPNIRLEVHRHTEDRDKRVAVLDEVSALAGPGLLYVATRRATGEYASELTARGLRAAAYHGALPAAERRRVHESFLNGQLDVVVATSAFGMGIDKDDVRFVVHADTPDSIDGYYQELGRAGRDGRPAQATLHYRPEDLALRRYFAARNPDAAELGALFDALRAGNERRAGLAEASGLSTRRVAALLALFSDTGSVTIGRAGARLRRGAPRGSAVAAALERVEERQRIDGSRIDMLREYAETRRCRRQVLLGYFGQQLEQPCGNCDTCADGSALTGRVGGDAVADAGEETSAAPSSPFGADDRVRHVEWGDGTVVSIEDDRITVFFESEGYKVLSLDLVIENALLSHRRG